MRRQLPDTRRFSTVVGQGVHVTAFDAALLARAFVAVSAAAAGTPLDSSIYRAGFVPEERSRVLALVEAFEQFAVEVANGEHASRYRQAPVKEMTSAEAAQRLGVTSNRVRQLVRDGQLKGSTVAGRMRVTRKSVEELREQREMREDAA